LLDGKEKSKTEEKAESVDEGMAEISRS